MPPRALWVPFPLGRPLGVPSDPDFQLGVVRSALAMLATATEPVIEDYPVEAPGPGPEPWTCPLALNIDADDSLAGRLLAEVGRLQPWASVTRRNRGRTLFGLSGAAVGQVVPLASALSYVAESGDVYAELDADIEWKHEMPFLLRHMAEDLRCFYHEAVAAQPGDTPPDHEALNTWIFGQTVLGEVLIALADHLTAAAAADDAAALIRNFIVPEGHYRGLSSFKNIPGGYSETP